MIYSRNIRTFLDCKKYFSHNQSIATCKSFSDFSRHKPFRQRVFLMPIIKQTTRLLQPYHNRIYIQSQRGVFLAARESITCRIKAACSAFDRNAWACSLPLPISFEKIGCIGKAAYLSAHFALPNYSKRALV